MSSQKSFQQTILLYQMQKTTPPGIELGMYSRFTFVENTINNSPKVLTAKFLGSDRVFCFISSFKKTFATITSQSELYFRFRRFICPFGTNEESDFYELWQQHKQLKTMEMNEAWPDIFYEGYIHQFQPEPTHKIY